QCIRVGLAKGREFLIAVSVDLIVQPDLRTTKLRKDVYCDLLISGRHVLDLRFTLGYIRIHFQNTQHKVLIGKSAGLNSRLEAVPVLTTWVKCVESISLGCIDLVRP